MRPFPLWEGKREPAVAEARDADDDHQAAGWAGQGGGQAGRASGEVGGGRQGLDPGVAGQAPLSGQGAGEGEAVGQRAPRAGGGRPAAKARKRPVKSSPSSAASTGQARVTSRARLRASAAEVALTRSGSNPPGTGPPPTSALTRAACSAASRS